MARMQKAVSRLHPDNIGHYILDLTLEHPSLIEYEDHVMRVKKIICNLYREYNGNLNFHMILVINNNLRFLRSIELYLEHNEIAHFYD